MLQFGSEEGATLQTRLKKAKPNVIDIVKI